MDLRVIKVEKRKTEKSGEFNLIFFKKVSTGLTSISKFGGDVYMMMASLEDSDEMKIKVGKVFKDEDESNWKRGEGEYSSILQPI